MVICFVCVTSDIKTMYRVFLIRSRIERVRYELDALPVLRGNTLNYD